MEILVTGTDGCIGGALKQHLLERGHKVFGTVFVRLPGRYECRLDLADPASFAGLPARSFDAIIHTAGIIDQSLPGQRIHEVNLAGTRRMTGWARRHGSRHFIFTGSISVYGVFTMGQRRSEKTLASVLTAPLPYMQAKLKAERSIKRSGLAYTILRLPAVIGCGDSYLSPAIISALVKDRFFFCGSGERLVSLVSVTNLCHVVEALLDHGPLGGSYNCADWHVRWHDLIARYAELLGKPLPEKRKSILTLIPRLSDKQYLLLLTFSFFGAHFPDDKLHRLLPHSHQQPWEEAVAEAVTCPGNAPLAGIGGRP